MKLTDYEIPHLSAIRNNEQPDTGNKMTVSALCAFYIDSYAKLHKKSWKLDESRCRMYIIPALGDRLIDSISRKDMSQLMTEIGRVKPYAANRVQEQICKMWALATDEWELLPNGHRNPAKGLKSFRECSRERFLDHSEVRRVFAALAVESYPVRLAVMLLLLTGMRKSEVLNLRWADVNFTRGAIRLPDTKSGRPHRVPLSPLVRELLETTRKRAPRGAKYVVAGETPSKPRNTITKAWTRICKRAELEDAHIHDLRRTVGSWLAQDGFSLHIIGGVLNQSTAHTTEVYARLNDAPIKSAFDHQSATIRNVLRLGDADPVIPPSLLRVREESASLDCKEIYQASKILSLTPRQLEVLMMFLSGYNGLAISEELGVRKSVVSFHLREVRRRLEIDEPAKGTHTLPFELAQAIRRVLAETIDGKPTERLQQRLDKSTGGAR